MSLMDLLPVDYAESSEVVEIQEALEATSGQAQTDAEDLCDQMFVDTATWGLSYWEQLYGITTNTTKTYEQRRTTIKGKMMGKSTTTVEAIRVMVESMVGGTVSVVEHNSEYYFVVWMDVEGAPSNILEVQEAILDMQPEHLELHLHVVVGLTKPVYMGGTLGQYRREEL